MAPPAAEVDITPVEITVPLAKQTASFTNKNTLDKPLEYTGSLDQYKSFEVANVIGREYPDLQLNEILADNTKIKDLAVIGLFKPQTNSARVADMRY